MNAAVVELDLAGRSRRPKPAMRDSTACCRSLRGSLRPVRRWRLRSDRWLARAGLHPSSRSGPRSRSVCGRLRERFPERSVYNRLADLEWESPARRGQGVRGRCHDPRLRRSQESGASTQRSSRPRMMKSACASAREGWKVFRIDAEMTLHDMAMTRFRQWWKRSRANRPCLRRG